MEFPNATGATAYCRIRCVAIRTELSGRIVQTIAKQVGGTECRPERSLIGALSEARDAGIGRLTNGINLA